MMAATVIINGRTRSPLMRARRSTTPDTRLRTCPSTRSSTRRGSCPTSRRRAVATRRIAIQQKPPSKMDSGSLDGARMENTSPFRGRRWSVIGTTPTAETMCICPRLPQRATRPTPCSAFRSEAEYETLPSVPGKIWPHPHSYVMLISWISFPLPECCTGANRRDGPGPEMGASDRRAQGAATPGFALQPYGTSTRLVCRG